MTSAPAALRAAYIQKEAATLLGVSVRTMLNWRQSGYGPQPFRDGNRWLYDRSAVEAFAAGAR